MTPTDTAHIHSLAHHTRLTPYGLGVAVSHPDVVSLSVVGGLGGMSRALTTTRWPSCCKANTNGQVANARRLAYRNTTLHRTTPDYVLVPESDQQHARSVHFSADGMLARMSEHRPRGYTLALAYELQVAHRMALQHLGQWPRHACPEFNVETEVASRDQEVGSVSRNNTISKGFNRLE